MIIKKILVFFTMYQYTFEGYRLYDKCVVDPWLSFQLSEFKLSWPFILISHIQLKFSQTILKIMRIQKIEK